MDTAQLNKLCDRLADIKDERKKLSDADNLLKDEQQEIEAKFIAALEEDDLEQFRGSRGLVSISNRFSVQTPKSVEDKKELFKYFQSKGIYWDMVSVNSMTLNSYYKAELEIAGGEGNIDFAIPGLKKHTYTKGISFTKKKD